MYAATDGRYTLCVDYDEDTPSPRECSNVGRMICFHRNYALGDKHDYGEPLDFLRDAYAKAMHDNGKALVRYLKSGKARGAKLEYNRQTHEWDLHECYYLRTPIGRSEATWEVTQSAPKSQLHSTGWFWEWLLDAMTVGDLLELMQELRDCVILPLYLYDHGGITMNTGGFSCPWDSGQVGWIFTDSDAIRKAYGNCGRKSMETATAALGDEVEVYDHYLQNDCWYYRLYDSGEEIDSSGGFIGDVESCGIEDCLPEDALHLLDELEWTELSEDSWLCA